MLKAIQAQPDFLPMHFKLNSAVIGTLADFDVLTSEIVASYKLEPSSSGTVVSCSSCLHIQYYMSI